MTSLCKVVLGVVTVGLTVGGCVKPDLGESVDHKPHVIGGGPAQGKKAAGADLDLLPAPPGLKTGTPK
ncbi:MAG: hypothetical protein P4L46_24525 [Fimbriimonas sp.]|nr:hypothetical protein [Fimbriimonas sp.]